MFNAERFLKDYEIPYITSGSHCSTGWININCPMSGCSDSNFHGGINLQGGYYHCWKCGGSSLVNIIRTLLLLSFSEASNLINEYSVKNKILNSLNKKIKHVSKIEMPGGSFSKIHKKYLRKRNFDPDYIQKKYKVDGCIATPRNFKYRLMIPIFHNNKLISYQGRDVTNKQTLRYKGCKLDQSVMNYKYTLYGLENTNTEKIAVVEGIFDQWRMGDGFVATFGTALTNYQIKLLSNFKKVYFLFDSEPHTQAKAARFGAELNAIGCETEIIDLELGNRDCGDLTPKEAQCIRKELGFV
jgi:hypothetical protein